VTKQWDAVVIGGGHNGLVAAAYLAKNGLDTLVCERRGVSGMLFPNLDRRVRKRRLAEILAGQWAASGVRNSIRASHAASAVWLPIAIILDGLG
jgi:flavin-dependent dehydrogenase